MALSLDHIFIVTKPEAAEAERLCEIGFIEGNANVHPGQGTSNRRFFLEGFTIELLYVSDADEAENGAGKRLGILSRYRSTNASPFGIVVRVSGDNEFPFFPNWQYFPDYFYGNMCFYVGDNSDEMNEPLCICMPPSLPESSSVAAEYSNPGWQLTALEIDVPIEKPSETLRHFAAVDRVRIEFGKPHKMTMKFNNGAAGKVHNLEPDLPLVLEW